MTLLVPAYFHPTRESADWARLLDAAHAGRVAVAVINPASGVGTGTDPAYPPVCAELAAAGVAVCGYVDTAYGRRPAAEVVAEAHAYADRYGVPGVFLDQVASGADLLPHYRALAGALPGAPLVLNPGVLPDPGYLAIADVVVTFEGRGADHRPTPAPRGHARIAHLVHGVGFGMLEGTHEAARRSGVDHTYVTDRALPNPWDGWPAVA